MATNGNADIALLNSFEIQPRSSSSPKTNAETLDVESLKPAKLKNGSSKTGPSSSKGSAGPSSPDKPHSSASSARASPSKAYALTNFAAKKSSNKVAGKSNEDIVAENSELKKTNSYLGIENGQLKLKLRKVEEDIVRRVETEKFSASTLISNMKRKIQRLEESVKEKDGLIKLLQADAKIAKHEAKIAIESTKFDAAGKRGKDGKEHAKNVATRAYLPPTRGANSGNSRGSDSATTTKIQSLVDENRQLKEKLHRALSVYDEGIIESYEGLPSEELIAEIIKVKEEMAGLKTIIEKIQSGTELSDDLTSALLLEEMERMKSSQRNLKEDNLSYYEASEKKDLEIQVLKEELEKERKERSAIVARSQGAIPKVPAAMSKAANRGLDNPKTSQRTQSFKKPAAESGKTTLSKSRPAAAASATAAASKKNVVPVSLTRKATPKIEKTSDVPISSPPSPIRAVVSSPSSGVVKGDTPPLNDYSPMPKEVLTDLALGASKDAFALNSSKNNVALDSSQDDVALDSSKDDVEQPHLEEFRLNVAAKKIQKTWKDHHAKGTSNGFDTAENEKVEQIKAITENHAARVIQNGWRNHKQNSDDPELDGMATTIQAVARAHDEREGGDSFVVRGIGDGDASLNTDFVLNIANLKDMDESATTIQSVARAHHHRLQTEMHNYSINGDTRDGNQVDDRRLSAEGQAKE